MTKVFTEQQVSKLVDLLVGRIVRGVSESINKEVTPTLFARPLNPPTPKSERKLAQPSDNQKKPQPIREGSRLLIVAGLRKGEGCDELAKKFGVGVGSVRAIKANLTRGAYD